MDRVLEHEVDEVGVRLYELIELLQVLELLTLAFVEDVEFVLAGVEVHVFNVLRQIGLLLGDLLVALLQLLLLFLQRADFFVDLLFHHLVQVLLLDLELLHDSAERLLQAVDLVVELFADFQLELRVEILTSWGLTLVHFNLGDHFLHHALHVQN